MKTQDDPPEGLNLYKVWFVLFVVFILLPIILGITGTTKWLWILFGIA